MFKAYFDASGKQRMKVLTVAGFVSRGNKWNRFQQEWETILNNYEISAFHMTDFAASKGPFVSWKGRTERRRALIAELVACTKRNVNKGFACSVVVDDFKAVNLEYCLRESVGSPYVLCGGSCLGGVLKWAKKKNTDPGRVGIFVEEGDEGKGDLMEAGSREQLTVTPLKKSETRAFEAADMVAWKCRVAVQDSDSIQTYEDGENILKSLNVITGTLHNNGAYDKDALRLLCLKTGISKRAIVKS